MTLITEQDAIRLAVEALQSQGTAFAVGRVRAIRKERHMRRGKNRCGWLVVVPLNVPYGFEPNTIDVEVYEPGGEIHIPMVL